MAAIHVQKNKTDAVDAKAICNAVKQPGMRTFAAKTENQRAMLSLLRMRSQLVKFRTIEVNHLRRIRKKQMPGCNGRDTGCNITRPESGQTSS